MPSLRIVKSPREQARGSLLRAARGPAPRTVNSTQPPRPLRLS